MGRILVIYDSGYGATADAARIIADNLSNEGLNVDLSLVGLKHPVGYDAAIIGSPIRLSRCTLKVKKFLKMNNAALKCMQIAFFFTCMSAINDRSGTKIPLLIDPDFNDPDKAIPRIKIMEKNHTVSYYLKHLLKIIPGISPLRISFFKGRLDFSRLSMFHRLIMRFAMFALPEIQNGDYLNKVAIQDWAQKLATPLKSGRHDTAEENRGRSIFDG